MSTDRDVKIAQLVAGRLVQLAGMSREELSNTTGPARAALLDHYRRRVDPDGILDEVTRDKRAMQARKVDLAALSARAVAAKKEKAAARRLSQIDHDLTDTLVLLVQHLADEIAAGSDLPAAA